MGLRLQMKYVHGTYRREPFRCTEMAADLEAVRRQWAEWENTCSRVRPHESLGLKTRCSMLGRDRQAGRVPKCYELARSGGLYSTLGIMRFHILRIFAGSG